MRKSRSKKAKRVLVVGGGGGIGRAIVRSLRRRANCEVWNFSKDRAGEAKEDRLFSIKGDVASERSVRGMLSRICGRGKSLDVVIFAPSSSLQPAPLSGKSWKHFQEHIDVGVKGLYLVAKGLLGQMEKGSPVKFIVIATEAVVGKPPPYLADYVTAKYGLLGLAKCLGVEFSKYGSTVNIVSPGFTKTSLLKKIPPRLIEAAAAANPLKRIARPEDIAAVVLFLAGSEASYLNGVHITVNGGNITF